VINKELEIETCSSAIRITGALRRTSWTAASGHHVASMLTRKAIMIVVAAGLSSVNFLVGDALAADLSGPFDTALGRDPSSPYVKNGLPCIAEICVGDDLRQVANLPWQVSMEDNLRSGIGPFRHEISTGSDAVDFLLKQTSFCTPAYPGSVAAADDNPMLWFKSQQGSETDVQFEVLATDDGRSIRYVVTNIQRHVAPAGTSLNQAQIEAVKAELISRYGTLPKHTVGFRNDVIAAFSLSNPARSKEEAAKIYDQLIHNPACSKAVNLN
jgi:hypothetical protein